MVFHHYSAEQPATSIQEAKDRHAEDFRKAEIGLTDPNEGFNISEAMLQFRDMDGMAPYYKFHANMVLAGRTDGMTYGEHIETSRKYFQAAGIALAEAQELYVAYLRDEDELKEMRAQLEGEKEVMNSYEEDVIGEGILDVALPSYQNPTMRWGIETFGRFLEEASVPYPGEHQQDWMRRVKDNRQQLLIDSSTPPDFRAKAHLDLSLCEPTSEDPKILLKEARMHLEAARKEYKKAKALFIVDPWDVEMLEQLRDMLKQPTEMYRERYWEVHGVFPDEENQFVKEETKFVVPGRASETGEQYEQASVVSQGVEKKRKRFVKALAEPEEEIDTLHKKSQRSSCT